MEINAILCNYAESAENKLYISGGGIDRCNVPPAGPFVIQVGIGLMIGVPYTATNQPHHIEVKLVDDDQKYVQAPQPDGSTQDLTIGGDFNVGRPPGLPVGASQNVALAINIGTPVPQVGQYHFEIAVDGSVEKRLPVMVIPLPAQFGGLPGSGPSAIPPL